MKKYSPVSPVQEFRVCDEVDQPGEVDQIDVLRSAHVEVNRFRGELDLGRGGLARELAHHHVWAVIVPVGRCVQSVFSGLKKSGKTITICSYQ